MKFGRVQVCVQNSAACPAGTSKRQRETIKVFRCKYYKTKQGWRWRWSRGVQRNVKYLRKEEEEAEEEEEEEKGCREISRDQKCGKRNGREKAKSRTGNENEEER